MKGKEFTVIDPAGKKYIVNAPPGATRQDAIKYIQTQQASTPTESVDTPQSGPMGAGEMFAGAGKNFASSGIKFGKDMVQMIAHPIDTAKSVYGLGKGVVQLMIPGEQGSEDMARAVGKHFKGRYGTIENIKKTFATDPVGFAADLSGLFTGGGMAMVGAGKAITKAGVIGAKFGAKVGASKIPSIMQKAGTIGREAALPGAVKAATQVPNMLQKAGSFVADAGRGVGSVGRGVVNIGNKFDPITIGSKTLSWGTRHAADTLAELQGVATGRGGMATKEAFRAGMKGGKNKYTGGGSKEFEAGMHHLEDADTVVAKAEGMLSDIVEARKTSYVEKFEAMVKENKTGKYNMDVTPIYDRMVKLSETLQDAVTGEHSIITNPAERANLVKIGEETINILNDPKMHNALGMDHLKKVLDNIDIPYGSTSKHKQAFRIRAAMSSMVKKEIKKKVHNYDAMLKPYEDGIRLERDLQKAFSLGQDATVDVMIKKLQASLSEGVHSGLGTKRKTLNQLDPSGKLATQLAGHALSTKMPTGIMRANMGIGAGGVGAGAGFMAGGAPGAAIGAGLTIGAQSPKLTGILNYNLGKTAAPFYKLGKTLGEEGGRTLGRGLLQAGRLKREEDKKKKRKAQQSMGGK
jgi:hypothetical protein